MMNDLAGNDGIKKGVDTLVEVIDVRAAKKNITGGSGEQPRGYKNTIKKSATQIYSYRKGYMAPDCNLYSSMIRLADAMDSYTKSER